MFASDEKEVNRRLESWLEWYKENEQTLIERYSFASIDYYPLKPSNIISIGDSKIGKITVTLPANEGAKVDKGLAVRLTLISALDAVDRRGLDIRFDSIFLLIDASSAFDFKAIYSVLEKLTARQNDRRVDVVFGRRPANDSGMVPSRRAIEDFENFLLLRSLKNSKSPWSSTQLIPDGQAGCWGFWLSAAAHIPLSAPSYEIEFDLLSSSFLANLNVSFTEPLPMGVRHQTNLATEDAIMEMSARKLNFICKKLKIPPRDLVTAFSDFSAIHANIAGLIPIKYGEIVDEFGTSLLYR